MISPGFIAAILATLSAALLTGWLIFEDWALWSHAAPVTDYTREAWRNHPHFFLLLLAVVCLVIGHFLWH